MPKNPSPHRVKRHLVYSSWEAADTLDIHRRTVERWIKEQGLKADQSMKPWLINGADLKSFLEQRRAKRRTVLAPGEVYCLACRQARMPAARMADFKLQTPTKGVLSGICPDCERLMHRFTKRSDLDVIRAVLDVTVRPALAGIEGGEKAAQTVPIREARKTHG